MPIARRMMPQAQRLLSSATSQSLPVHTWPLSTSAFRLPREADHDRAPAAIVVHATAGPSPASRSWDIDAAEMAQARTFETCFPQWLRRLRSMPSMNGDERDTHRASTARPRPPVTGVSRWDARHAVWSCTHFTHNAATLRIARFACSSWITCRRAPRSRMDTLRERGIERQQPAASSSMPSSFAEQASLDSTRPSSRA